MIAAVLCLGVTLQAGTQTLGPSQTPASDRISAMMALYYNAKTLTGKIVLSQSVGNEAGEIVTTIQYERPAKLFIRQDLKGASRRTWVATSDGKHFSYDKPESELGQVGRLVEPVNGKYGQLTLPQIYAVVSYSLGDRSAPIDMAIARREDLAFLKGQWVTVLNGGTTQSNGTTLHVVRGDWRPVGSGPATGTYEIWLGADNSLRAYFIREPMLAGASTVMVESRWDVDLKVNGAVNPDLFKLIL